MKDILLQALSNSDINWILANCHQQEIASGMVLVHPDRVIDNFYILLEGTLAASVSKDISNPLTRAFATLEAEETPSLEIMRLSSGEVIGENFLVANPQITTTIKALEKCLLTAIPTEKLEIKLKQDAGFASRFYQAIAILYSNRIQVLLNRLGYSKKASIHEVKDILFIFAELHDSDLSWLVTNGIVQRLSRKTTLISQGRPVDALYLLLQGKMAISISHNQDNPLTRIFATLEGSQSSEQEIAKLYKGEIVGESIFVDGRLPYASIKTIEDSLVLAIPRPKLMAKLQQDVGFASRFYKAITTLLANRLQIIMTQMGYGRRVYSQGLSLSENVVYDDEIDFKSLEKMSVAAVKFDWMIENLTAV